MTTHEFNNGSDQSERKAIVRNDTFFPANRTSWMTQAVVTQNSHRAISQDNRTKCHVCPRTRLGRMASTLTSSLHFRKCTRACGDCN